MDSCNLVFWLELALINGSYSVFSLILFETVYSFHLNFIFLSKLKNKVIAYNDVSFSVLMEVYAMSIKY